MVKVSILGVLRGRLEDMLGYCCLVLALMIVILSDGDLIGLLHFGVNERCGSVAVSIDVYLMLVSVTIQELFYNDCYFAT
jgi:hypothetical protein